MMKRLSMRIPVKVAAIFLFICIFMGLSLPFNLASITVFAQPKEKNKVDLLKECTENLKELATAVYLYSTDYQGHYPKQLSSIIPMYYNKSTIEIPPEGVELEEVAPTEYPVLLTHEGMKKFIMQFEGRLQEKTFYPPLEKRFTFKDICLEQVRLLVRAMNGEAVYEPYTIRQVLLCIL